MIGDVIGVPGATKVVHWSSSIKESMQERYAFQESASRRWAFVAHRRPLREWGVSFDSQNEDCAHLYATATGLQGESPIIFVPATACISNVLTPAQADLSGVANTVLAGRPAVTGGASVTLASGVPVIPGEPFTASVAYFGASTVLLVRFRSATGAFAGTKQVTAGQLEGTLYVSVPSVPAAAVSADIVVSGHVTAGSPCAYFTGHEQPFAPGGGCASAVISSLSREGGLYERPHGDVWWGCAVTITEVG